MTRTEDVGLNIGVNECARRVDMSVRISISTEAFFVLYTLIFFNALLS